MFEASGTELVAEIRWCEKVEGGNGVENHVPIDVRRALLQQVAPRYQQASASQKRIILDGFVCTTGYVRKYAQWLLNHAEEALQNTVASRCRYGLEVQHALVLAWKTLNQICTKRLIPFLPRPP